MQGPAGSASQISPGVVVRGEISGTEDLYVDGQVDGVIELTGNVLTVGPQGRVKANVQARSIVVAGRVEGNLIAGERIELRKTAVVVGDIAAQRVVVEEGAFVKGSLDIRKDIPKSDAKLGSVEMRPSATVGTAASPVPATAPINTPVSSTLFSATPPKP